ncbi:dehydrogenase [Lentzea sp. NBRC 105346]|uniref:thiamine pyrophosphate-dependent dehydrogenase E1 component subunit alpha n=1 Tax=Lentzea sp. NBRC 105346 TaxID=3032205 RepID=UPI0024A59E92|nr:thiamine pyrophosphate-dependent dehydrogenase E1 component subunit alpha [Lentzea sp. NBRC 105346]GLZ36294.1 dehydrogenase [Lentzea sp. NBRC 105346]
MLSDDDLELLLSIRHFELALLRMFDEGKLNGTTHTCLGQEYIPVALAPLLTSDFVLSNHRGHGHYLAHARDPSGLLAEIMGRSGAVCNGVGGSQHVHTPGFLSTGVQGQGLPLAVGMGLRFKRDGSGRIAVVYVGDGTWGEGTMYEALNMASLWQVPVLVVVENNGIAQSTPTSLEMAGTVADRVRAFGVSYLNVSTKDVASIRSLVSPVVASVRTGRPAVVEFMTTRLGPHSKGDDTRPADEVSSLHDWYSDVASDPRLSVLESRVRSSVSRMVDEVSARPPSSWPDLVEAGS